MVGRKMFMLMYKKVSESNFTKYVFGLLLLAMSIWSENLKLSSFIKLEGERNGKIWIKTLNLKPLLNLTSYFSQTFPGPAFSFQQEYVWQKEDRVKVLSHFINVTSEFSAAKYDIMQKSASRISPVLLMYLLIAILYPAATQNIAFKKKLCWRKTVKNIIARKFFFNRVLSTPGFWLAKQTLKQIEFFCTFL